jgi:hypothetical protein
VAEALAGNRLSSLSAFAVADNGAGKNLRNQYPLGTVRGWNRASGIASKPRIGLWSNTSRFTSLAVPNDKDAQTLPDLEAQRTRPSLVRTDKQSKQFVKKF